MGRKEQLIQLVEEFNQATANGLLQNASEETMRTWINRLLGVFGWDVSNTQQVLQERVLEKDERERLHNIGSRYIKPDYTLMNGTQRLFFLDAKRQDVNIHDDKAPAFQIRSYGWSIGAPYSIVTDFEEMAIYDCQGMPHISDTADFARLHYFEVRDYVENFDILEQYLGRERVLSAISQTRHNASDNLDRGFASFLCDIKLKLATSIAANNDGISIYELNLWSQIILNRILFIRVCEARGLETEGLLLDFQKKGFWEEFKQSSYLTFYEHYDGPMFERIDVIHRLVIGNEVFDELLTYLYYPSPYCFDVIPLKSISDIYDLFLGYHLEEKDGRLCNVLKSEFQKSNGAVTTPMSLVEATINATLPADRLAQMGVEDVMGTAILDPACGSGVFLVGVFDLLLRKITEEIKANPGCVDSQYYSIINCEPVLNLYGKKLIVSQCLYGIDINQESVEVAKLSLSLKIIDGYELQDYDVVGLYGSKILDGVGVNIKCGNTLVGSDVVTAFPSILKDPTELTNTNIFDWEAQFEAIAQKGGFDYVIGNPPYVEVKNYNVELPTMATYIKRRYRSSRNGKIDLAIPFIERGLEMLNDRGSLGFLVQKRFFKTEYGKGIRKFVSEGRLLREIYDYAETDLFADRITYVAILVCDKSHRQSESFTYTSSIGNIPVTVPKLMATETPWNFDDLGAQTMRLRKSAELGTLEDVCNIKVGVQVLWDPAYHILVEATDDDYVYGRTALQDNLKIEKAACRVLLCNEKFVPLSKRPETTYILFPYDVNEGEVAEITFSEYTRRYPLAGAYLSRHRSQIEANVQTLPMRREDLDKDEYWHLFTRANNHNAVYRKLCIPMTTQNPQAAVVMREDAYCDNANMFFIQLEDNTDQHLYALAGVINSTPFAYFSKMIANPQQGGFFKFNKQFLNPVPFPVQAFTEMNDKILEVASIAKQIEEYHSMMETSPSRANRLTPALIELWRQLDIVCCDLYGFTDEETALFMSNPRNDHRYA